jgi:phage recombination protein Bet
MSADLAPQQGGGVTPYSADELQLIRDVCARDCTETEFRLLIQLAKTYRLDPFSRQIWAVKYGSNPAQIFCGRDGYLAIAHRSGQFDGMESGTRTEGGELVGWCRVYRRDMSHPFEVEVYASEYSTGRNLWKDKPRTMIQKVAEAQCLRRAFSISGLYSPEEIDTGEPHMATPAQVREVPKPSPTCCAVCGCEVSEDIREKTRPYTDRVLCIEHFQAWWAEQKKEGGEQ